jgi:enoyl-CoA hydratase/carnithine racemase
MYETIILEKAADGVATLILNRPDHMNSFNRKMVEECRQAWCELREDDSVRTILLRASEGRAFSTGRDTREGARWVDDRSPWLQSDPGEWLGPKQNKLWKPVVCAVHGMACAGAFYWINEADIVICSDDAQFFEPHVSFGRTAAVEPVGLLQRIALGEVLRMALMGNDERIGAETALRIGLVSEVVPLASLFGHARDIAVKIAAKPSVSTQGTVRAIWEALDMPRSIALANALKYCQIGNEIGLAQIDAKLLPKPKWTLR